MTGPALSAIEILAYLRGLEVFGRRNEVKHNFVPPNAVRIYENFADSADNGINFDAEGGSWIDFRPQYHTAIQDVSTSVLFFHECDGRDVTFEYNAPRDGGNNSSFRSRRNTTTASVVTGVTTPPPLHSSASMPTTPVVDNMQPNVLIVRKRIQVEEIHIVLTKLQVQLFLEFSEVLHRLRNDYRIRQSSNNNPSTPVTSPGGMMN